MERVSGLLTRQVHRSPRLEPGVIAHTHSPSTWEVQTGADHALEDKARSDGTQL